MKNRYKLAALGLVLLVLLALLGLCSMTGANASENDEPCTEIITVVDEEAWAETIVHPAVTEEIPGIWGIWAPNDTQGPQDYVPIWPLDERGTWIAHQRGIPEGHAGPDGVYQQGEGNSPWFYREAGRTVVISEAWVETIEHAAVTHEETVEVDCPEEPPVVCPEEPGANSRPLVTEGCETPEEPPVVVNVPKEPKDHKIPVTPTAKTKTPAKQAVPVPTVVDAGL